MQMLPLDRKPVLGPLLLDVDERALPLTEQQVLEGRNREQVVFGEHGDHRTRYGASLRQLTDIGRNFQQSDPFRQTIAVDCHGIVTELAWGLVLVVALDFYKIEQLAGSGVAKGRIMLKEPKAAGTHFAAGC